MKKLILLIIAICTGATLFAQGTWAGKANFPGSTNDRPATFTINGEIYVCGGSQASGTNVNSLWKFNPQTNVWTQLANFSGIPRVGALAFNTATNGYVGLGFTWLFNKPNPTDFWKYDPMLNAWSGIAHFPGLPRSGGISFSLNNKGYIGSGFNNDVSASELSGMWQYDPAADTWTQKAEFPVTEDKDPISFTIDSMGYAGTGGGPGVIGSEFFQYNPVTNIWTRKASFGGGPLEAGFGFGLAHKGYVGTGTYYFCGDCMLNTVWVYNPSVDVWARVADFSGQARNFANGVSVNGKGYVMFGKNEANMLSDVWEYTADNLTEQKITFSTGPAVLTTTPDFDPGATTTSNLPITYTSGDETKAQIVYGKIHIVGAGYVDITASQPGNSSFRPAIDVTRTYNFVTPRTDALLHTLTISTGTLSPAFSSTTFDYSVSVANSINSISVTPGPEDAEATVKVNGTAVQLGSSSSPIPLHVGVNSIAIAVTAQDGTTVKNYTIAVTRAGAAIATLSNLAISSGSLNPVFNTALTSYTAIVPNAVSAVKITPAATDAEAAIKVNGTLVGSGSASADIALAVGSNVINTVITSSDGTTNKTYTITVTRAAAGLSTNAILSIIKTTPAATLTATTGPGYKNYITSVANSVKSIQIIPTAQDATAVINVNGHVVASGSPSQAISLHTGANTITVTVTAQDGATVKSYIITAARATSTVATLANITTSVGIISPAFTPATVSYNATVPNATSSVTLTPTATDVDATIKINGVTVVSGSPLAVALNAGANTITTVVTASDDTTTKTYTLTITRAAAGLSTNAILSVITLTPKATLTTTTGPGYKNYTATVPNTVRSIQVTPTAQAASATIKVNGATVASGALSNAITLNTGANTINITVTAQDGATVKNYIITVTRAASIIATLSNLAISAGTLNPAFAASTTSYTAIIPYATSSVQLTPTLTDVHATIKVNGAAVPSGTASGVITLAVGSNTITTVVTAPDGTTNKTYTLTVSRAAAGLSANAALSVIALTPKTTLTANGTANGVTSYATSVPFSESSLKVTPTAQAANATIKVNGTTVASGAASQSVPLAVGNNQITLVCTAPDGATTRTYVIMATRAASGLVMKYDEGAALPLQAAGVTVRQGLSPNGDGYNDVLTIEGISNYPDNTLQIMSRSGQLVYGAKGYNNSSIVFDGHASQSGKMQPAGTYFYSLDYKDGNELKHKTGFIVLKY